MKKIKCVVFDADGMVINSEVFSVQLEKDYRVSNDMMLPFFKGPFQECIVGKADLKKEIAPFIKKGGWEKSVDELLDYWFKIQHKLDDRIIQEIKRLREKGIRCYLASNQEKYRAEYIRKDMGLENIFDDIFLSSDIGCKKPQEEFYEKIFQKITSNVPVEKQQIMFWDDKEENAGKARQFGFEAHTYEDFEKFEKEIKNII